MGPHLSIFESSYTIFAHYLPLVHVSTGHAHFSNDKIHISCEPDRPTSLFVS